jgi:hypothetical protein
MTYKPTYELVLDGPDAFIARIQHDMEAYHISRGMSVLHKNDTSFAPTIQTTAALLTQGWREGRELMQPAMADAALHLTPKSIATQSYDVGGYYPCPARAAAGDPLSMVNFGQDMIRTKPVVRLFADQSVSCLIDQNQIINRGAAILSHIDNLEAQGFRVELTLGWRFCTEPSMVIGAHTMHVDCIVKNAEDVLNLDWLAFMLAHPGIMRRFMIRHMDVTPELLPFGNHMVHGYPSIAEQRTFEGGVYLPGANTKDWKLHSIADAVKYYGGLLSAEIPRVYGDSVADLGPLVEFVHAGSGAIN